MVKEIIIQDKKGNEKERIRLSNSGFRDVLKYAREKEIQDKETDSLGLVAYVR